VVLQQQCDNATLIIFISTTTTTTTLWPVPEVYVGEQLAQGKPTHNFLSKKQTSASIAMLPDHRSGSWLIDLLSTLEFWLVFRIHYKEYLVGLVNRHGIDPAEVMTADELCTLLERAEKKTLRRKRDESVSQHTRRLLDVCPIKINK